MDREISWIQIMLGNTRGYSNLHLDIKLVRNFIFHFTLFQQQLFYPPSNRLNLVLPTFFCYPFLRVIFFVFFFHKRLFHPHFFFAFHIKLGIFLFFSLFIFLIFSLLYKHQVFLFIPFLLTNQMMRTGALGV